MSHAKLKTNILHCAKLGLSFCCLAVLLLWCDDAEHSPVETTKIPKAGDYEISVKIDTLTRWFKLVIPSNYDHKTPRPLLLCFHGGKTLDYG